MDTLRAMHTFVQIADQGSLTAAARTLDTSLPAVVRALAALEQHLGVRLFNRTTRRIALTDEGRAYLDSCRHVLSAVQDAEAVLKEGAREPTGQLTVTAPVQFGQMFVAPAMTAFAQQHPRVRCRVLLFDRVVNLLDEGIDVGVRIGALDDSALVARPVGTIRRVVVASPALLDGTGTPAQPQALRGARCIRFTGAEALGWRFDVDGRKVTVEIGGNLEFNHIAPAVDACVAGAGFGMFLSYQVAPFVASGRLQVVLEAFEPPPRPVHIVYPHARLLPHRTRLCIDWLKQALTGPNGPFSPAGPAGTHGGATRA
jgi:DNA-binding transcriptional LysR family regulator